MIDIDKQFKKVEELLSSKKLKCVVDPYGRYVGTWVSGVAVEYNNGTSPVAVKLIADNKNEDVQDKLDNWVIENYGEDSIIQKRKAKTSTLVNFLPNLDADKFIEVVELLQETDFELEFNFGSKPKRGQIDFDSSSIFLKLAKTYRFAEYNGLPQLVARGSSIMDSIDDIITVGQSVSRTEDNSYREHVVPCDYLGREAIEMIREGKSDTEVAVMLQQNLFIVLITNEEAKLLDSELGLKTDMPDGWSIGGDPMARLQFAGIKIKK